MTDIQRNKMIGKQKMMAKRGRKGESCVCVCVCVCERERERERKGKQRYLVDWSSWASI